MRCARPSRTIFLTIASKQKRIGKALMQRKIENGFSFVLLTHLAEVEVGQLLHTFSPSLNPCRLRKTKLQCINKEVRNYSRSGVKTDEQSNFNLTKVFKQKFLSSLILPLVPSRERGTGFLLSFFQCGEAHRAALRLTFDGGLTKKKKTSETFH